MKKVFALTSFLVFSQALQADPVTAPPGSTWVKIESVEATFSQINIQGYVEGSTVLNAWSLTNPEPAFSHCLRSFYLMMEKPGKYAAIVNYDSCILKLAK